MSIQTTEQNHLIPVYPKRDVALVKGKGLRVWDEAGQEYIDCMMGHGSVILGHGMGEFSVALSMQLNDIIGVHSSFYNNTRANFLELLHSVLPDELTHSFISNSGTESVEAALKFARLITGKPGVVSMKQGYHGRTLGALSVNGTPKYRKAFEPLLQPNTLVSFNDIEALEEAITEEVGAVILEPIQGEGGVRMPNPGYLESVRQLCTDRNVIFILDEVQTVLRTGSWLASEEYGVVPDILCIAKGLGNGIPIGVTVIKEQYVESIPRGSHGTTFGSNALSCAAAHYTLQYIIDNQLHDNTLAMGAYLLDGIRAIESSMIREVRGKGLMLAIELKQRAGKIAQQLQIDAGLITMPGGTLLRLLPPVTITQADADEIIKRLSQVL